MNSRKIWSFLKLTRPLFLGGGILLYLLGTMIAIVDGAPFKLERFISGQILVTAIQLMTHYANEYFDLEGDRVNQARTWFSGGSGILASGELSPKLALRAALIMAAAALLALVVAGWQVPVVLAFGLISLLTAWSYSAPPLSLARRGLGELSASLVVAGLVPVVGYAMQSGGKVSLALLITCLPLILIHFAMLIAFQLPDYQADRSSGKRTLCVRMGKERVSRLHNALIFIAFCTIVVLSLSGWPGAGFAWLTLPLALWQIWRIQRYLGRASFRFQALTMGAISLFALTAGLYLAGYAWILLAIPVSGGR